MGVSRNTARFRWDEFIRAEISDLRPRESFRASYEKRVLLRASHSSNRCVGVFHRIRKPAKGQIYGQIIEKTALFPQSGAQIACRKWLSFHK